MYREIKSYVLRAGRVSHRQQQGLECWFKNYQLSMGEAPWDFNTLFGSATPVIVEIGFGMGASLCSMAITHPERRYIGVEVHQPGVGSLAAQLHEQQVTNVSIVNHDAVAVFQQYIPDNSLAGIQIFFPDPWPKKRHHKRRLIQPEFIHLLTKKIQPGGFIHCATDWFDYAEQMLVVLSEESMLANQQKDGGYTPRPSDRPLTKFEQRGSALGHGVWDLVFIKR